MVQIPNTVKYPHGNDAGCGNTLCRECPFRMRMSKHADVMTRVHTGRDGQGVSLNRNVGANILEFNQWNNGRRGRNPPSSNEGPERQGRRIEDPGGARREPSVRSGVVFQDLLVPVVEWTYDQLDSKSIFTREITIGL